MTVLRNGRLVGEYRTAELLAAGSWCRRWSAASWRCSSGWTATPAEPAADDASRRSLAASGLGPARARSSRSTSRCGPARWSAWPGCSGPAAPSSPGCCSAPTAPTPARSPWTARTAAAARRRATAIDAGIAFSSEDRKAEGVVGDLTVRDNIVLALQASRGWMRRIPRRRQDELVERWIELLDIRPADPDALMRNLSGGNQQKVLLARWLITEPRLLILDEPTRGIDVGAKAQIQTLVAELAAAGHGRRVHLRRAGGGGAPVRPGRSCCATAGRSPSLPGEDVDMDRVMELIATGGTGERPMRELLRKPFWPLVALLAAQRWPSPRASSRCALQDGRLYGSLIDILHNGAPLALVALGMTLVIATRGIDLSVGAVVAIAGARGVHLDRGQPGPGEPRHSDRRDRPSRSACAVALGAWNGFLVARARHPADHRDPRADDRRPRAGPADHRRPDHHREQPAVRRPRPAVRCSPCR